MKMLRGAALPAFAMAAYVLTGPVQAGDAAKGEADFKKCKSCHSITAPDGTDIVKGGKVGPNLYGVVGRQVASYEGYKYGDSIASVGASGLIWDEAEIAVYLADPKGWVVEKTGDAAAKTKMTFSLKTGDEDMAAYLASVAQ